MKATYQLLFSGGTSEEAKASFQKGFNIYEQELSKRLPEGPFFGGKEDLSVFLVA